MSKTSASSVKNIASRTRVGHGFDGPPALERAEDRQQQNDLHHADQQPAGGAIGVLQHIAHADAEQQRLHDRFEQQLLQIAEPGDHILHQAHRRGAGLRTAAP
jgi:hypothetical protein